MRSRGSQLLAGVLMSALMLTIMLAALVLALNTEQGRRMLANAINQASDGQIVITDLGGWIPLAPRLGALELRDRDGVWLRVQDAAMRLELGALTRGTLAVTSLTARSAGLARLPRRDADAASAFSLPLPVELRRLTVEQLDLGQVVQGAPRLTIDGSARYLGAGAAAASVLLTAADVRADAASLAEAAGYADQLYQAKGDFHGMNGCYAAGILEGVAHYLPESVRLWADAEA